jgi:glycosyltransferase involved in cell wall biosynthesis
MRRNDEGSQEGALEVWDVWKVYPKMNKFKISVIIPTHGNRDLSKAIESFNNSTVKPHEVLIINRGLERSIQRNMGINESTGNVILWLDSDQSISPVLIAECIQIFQTGVSAIYVPEVIVAKSLFGKVRAFERSFLTGTAVDVPRLVLKNVCPRFNEDLNGPEDADFGRRIPGIRAVSKNVLYHNDDIGIIEYIRKKWYYSKSMRKYANIHRNDPCINLWYRCVTVFVGNNKWKKLLRHPILTIGVILLLILRGIIYVLAPKS